MEESSENAVIKFLRSKGERNKIELPDSSLICSKCPLARWTCGMRTLKCYCPVSHEYMWTTDDRADILLCNKATESKEEK